MLKRLREATFQRFREAGIAKYPADHEAGMRVPKGGSSCASCRFLKDDQKSCGNKYFVRWNGGSKLIPGPIDSYCSDWYEPKKKVK